MSIITSFSASSVFDIISTNSNSTSPNSSDVSVPQNDTSTENPQVSVTIN